MAANNSSGGSGNNGGGQQQQSQQGRNLGQQSATGELTSSFHRMHVDSGANTAIHYLISSHLLGL